MHAWYLLLWVDRRDIIQCYPRPISKTAVLPGQPFLQALCCLQTFFSGFLVFAYVRGKVCGLFRSLFLSLLPFTFMDKTLLWRKRFLQNIVLFPLEMSEYPLVAQCARIYIKQCIVCVCVLERERRLGWEATNVHTYIQFDKLFFSIELKAWKVFAKQSQSNMRRLFLVSYFSLVSQNKPSRHLKKGFALYNSLVWQVLNSLHNRLSFVWNPFSLKQFCKLGSSLKH